MSWRGDDSHGTTEEHLEYLRKTIRDDGWVVQQVGSEARPLAYTVGLHRRGLPELLMTGLSAEVSNRVLGSISHMTVDDGTVLEPTMHIDYEDRFLIEVVAVEHPDVHMRFAADVFGPDFAALQLVWGDEAGRFPWVAEWGDGRRWQPVLGCRAEVPS